MDVKILKKTAETEFSSLCKRHDTTAKAEAARCSEREDSSTLEAWS